MLALLRTLHAAALVVRGFFTRLCAPLLTATTRAFSRAAAAVVGHSRRRTAASALAIPIAATDATDAATTDAGVFTTPGSDGSDGSDGPDDITHATENDDDATQQICVLLFSSHCGAVRQRADTNRTRDLLHDMDLRFVEMDVATTIDMRDKLLQLDLLQASNTRAFPQVFTIELNVGADRPLADRIHYISPDVLQQAEYYLGTPVTELARLSVLHLSVHRLFAGVAKRKASNALTKQVLALPSASGDLSTHLTTAALYRQ